MSKDGSERKGSKLSIGGAIKVAQVVRSLSKNTISRRGTQESNASRTSVGEKEIHAARGSAAAGRGSLQGPEVDKRGSKDHAVQRGSLKRSGSKDDLGRKSVSHDDKGSLGGGDADDKVGSWVWLRKRFAAGHFDIISAAIENDKVKPAAKDGDLGHSISMCAIYYGQIEMLKLLVRKKADLGYVDQDGFTALSVACKANRLNLVEYLIELHPKGDKGGELQKQLKAKAPKKGSNWTPLHWAAVNGNTELAMLLLEHKAPLDAFDARGYTPLMWACSHGHEELVRILVERGACLDGASACAEGYKTIRSRILLIEQLNNALLDAACRGDAEGLFEAIEAGAQIDARDDQGWTALMWFAVAGAYDIVKVLMAQKADIYRADVDGRTPLALARDQQYNSVADLLERTINGTAGTVRGAQRGDFEMAKAGLEEYGGRIQQAADFIEWGPAQWAASRGDVPLLKYLLQKKSDPERRDAEGRTCALIAAGCGSVPSLKLLAKNKADLDARTSNNEGALLLAARNNSSETVAWVVEHFLSAGKHKSWKDLWKNHAEVTKDADKAVLLAAKRGCIGVLQALHDAEANLNSKNKNNENALMAAVRGNHLDAAALLAGGGKAALENTSPKSDNQTPLFFAAQAGRARLCEILLEKKADVNAKDKNGETPLHVASKKNHWDCVQTLVMYGASTTLKNEKKKAPVDVCPRPKIPKKAWDPDAQFTSMSERLGQCRLALSLDEREVRGRVLDFRRQCGDTRFDQDDDDDDTPESSPRAFVKTRSKSVAVVSKAKARPTRIDTRRPQSRSTPLRSLRKAPSSPSIGGRKSKAEPSSPRLGDKKLLRPSTAGATVNRATVILARPQSAPSCSVAPSRLASAERILRVAGRQNSAELWKAALTEAEVKKKKAVVVGKDSKEAQSSHTRSGMKHAQTTGHMEGSHASRKTTQSPTPAVRKTEPDSAKSPEPKSPGVFASKKRNAVLTPIEVDASIVDAQDLNSPKSPKSPSPEDGNVMHDESVDAPARSTVADVPPINFARQATDKEIHPDLQNEGQNSKDVESKKPDVNKMEIPAAAKSPRETEIVTPSPRRHNSKSPSPSPRQRNSSKSPSPSPRQSGAKSLDPKRKVQTIDGLNQSPRQRSKSPGPSPRKNAPSGAISGSKSPTPSPRRAHIVPAIL
eukprot:gnl/MRDRNA2_/MRDRNA2_48881_c0_seq1.p1 gnl/MRDRNA2_/MRDRNA2_48881_c0~~gnl/MRDRNA2_/MRDRNA2_48881_c0_seq1.p1  ORF type:complete len:1164 (-),score=239.84 gnl/MRDRNA2_/MRDRNA2_48881_c0_seq1:267-3758(-)